MLALFNSGSKVNAIYLTFAKELGLSVRPIDIGAQKIDITILDTYGIVVAAFSVIDKAKQRKLIEETFLIANVSPEIVFGMSFLTLSDANVGFLDRKFR